MNADGVAAAAPCEIVAPVACVNPSVVANVPYELNAVIAQAVKLPGVPVPLIV